MEIGELGNNVNGTYIYLSHLPRTKTKCSNNKIIKMSHNSFPGKTIQITLRGCWRARWDIENWRTWQRAKNVFIYCSVWFEVECWVLPISNQWSQIFENGTFDLGTVGRLLSINLLQIYYSRFSTLIKYSNPKTRRKSSNPCLFSSDAYADFPVIYFSQSRSMPNTKGDKRTPKRI